jgi:hypothetical protein
LDPVERSALELRLREDAKDYYQSAVVSFVDGLRSIPAGFCSWATVKFYYSAFYSLRSRLALSGECIFYDGTKPRSVSVVPGAVVTALNGTTHKCVLARFASAFPYDSFLSQEIATCKPLEWLVDRREEVNYKQSRFSEPAYSAYLSYAAKTDARKMLSAYLSDDVYIHDPDHALVAFPFRLLVDLRRRLNSLGLDPLVQNEIDFLATQMRDRTGSITALASLLR